MATLHKYNVHSLRPMLNAAHRKWVVLKLQVGRLAGIGKTSQAVHDAFGFMAVVLSGAYTVLSGACDLLWGGVEALSRYVDPLTDLLAAFLGQCRLAVLKAQSRHEERGRLIPAMMLLTVTVCICTASFLGVSLRVSVDGRTMGYVESRDEMESMLRRVEAQVSDYLGTPYSLNLDVTYSLGYRTGAGAVNEESLSNYVLSGLDGQAAKYVLSVDGQIIGANESRTALELLRRRMLEQNTQSYRGGRVSFVQDVEVQPMGGQEATLMSIGEMESRLSGNTRESVVYTVQSGDTVSGIAYKYGVSLSDILAINPGLQPEKIMIGDQITVSASVPTLSVQETVTESYTRRVGYETVKEKTDALYTTQSRVKQAGVYGEAAVVADVVYVNGEEQARTILQWETISEPVDEIIEVGTKKPPKKAATGNFMKPSNGYFSSAYGYRKRFGDFHTGVDFAGATGSSIFASDGGKVTYAGWKGNYGYVVFIDHGNGYTTVYAHCSKLLVKAGQSVAKGETIARVGSTGRSTGPHLHFEIRVNGRHTNPLQYISK